MHKLYGSLPAFMVWISIVLNAGCAAYSADTAKTAANQTASTAPAASQPAEDVVLVRFGKDGNDATLTQAEFEKGAKGLRPALYDNTMIALAREKLFMLYIQDHPDLVPTQMLEEAIDQTMHENKCKTREEFERKLHETGYTWQEMQDKVLINKALATLILHGQKAGETEEKRRKRFEAAREEFDGMSVNVRQIQINIYPYDTPAQCEEKRACLAKVRQDIIAGKIKWENATKQGNGRIKITTRDLGNVSRHVTVAEPIAKAAFELKVDQISEIVESEIGLHILQVIGRQPGNRPFEHPDTQKDLRMWLEYEPLQLAMAEARAKYPVIGVQPPLPPPPTPPKVASASAPATRPSTQPSPPRSKMRFPPMPNSKSAKSKPSAVTSKPAKH